MKKKNWMFVVAIVSLFGFGLGLQLSGCKGVKTDSNKVPTSNPASSQPSE